MNNEIKEKVDERLKFFSKNPDLLHITKHTHKYKEPTYSVRLSIYHNAKRKSRYIGRYSTLSLAIAARDYALKQIELDDEMSMTVPSRFSKFNRGGA